MTHSTFVMTRRRFIALLLSAVMATTLFVFTTPEPAEAHPICNIPPNWHDHYHFPYAHRDDWNYAYSSGNYTTTLYRHWYNFDHDYYASTSDCI